MGNLVSRLLGCRVDGKSELLGGVGGLING